MQRRALLTASVASATVATLKAASAATEGPFGETGVPLVVPSSERLTLGPLSGSRYPDPHIEALDEKRFKGRVGEPARLNAWRQACAGPKGRLTLRLAGTWCSVTFRTIG